MTFDALQGHDAAVAYLRAILASRRTAPAYLFHGPRGVGKASAARAFACGLLCDRETAPCDACDSCARFGRGVHEDYLSLAKPDDRDDILVESVREAVRSLFLRPVRSPRRVLFVDDAETLNASGQNAMLKTLEEPPGAAVILLVASSDQALLPTVRSRCQRVRFGPLPEPAVAAMLVRDQALEPPVAARLASLAGGSPGMALDLLPRRDEIARMDEALEACLDGGPLDPVLHFVKGGSGDEGRGMASRARARLIVQLVAQRLGPRRRQALESDAGVEGLDALADAPALIAGNVNPSMVVADLLIRLRANP